ncbi:1878_t:CDS:10 [Entrophospora sp. SA101]|nr:1878_t:CDS:10 [Entrophospora sp. SA101]
MPYYRLKDLIKAIRACKTAADERTVIQKESAAIRTSFKEENNDARHSNVAKLLYIHMLGYPAHFGQIECLKLVASNRFADKRLGYLGIMLLLDENQEVLTLVTNSLKNDMNHSNMYVVGLALCTMGNISSPEMARDLCAEVEKLLGSFNTYIRKKAALCAMRIIRKVPELQENFLSKAKSLLNDRNHGVLLTAITLITEMCSKNSETLQAFRKAVPLLVRHLKTLVSAGFSPEHDVTGVTDPFLQIKILRLLRILGKGDSEASEAMNDVLAQVATNTESAKNVGNAILYETVQTIMEIQSESDLRVLAINILGKFLTNRDNNIRYVALTTLNKTVTLDTNAVQRHRNIILDCLRDADISIRRRALELTFALINESNVRVLTRELLAFLEVADNEFKQGMTTKAGNYVREEILSNFIRLVAHTSELHAYTVQKLYSALKDDISQESLTLSGVWVIGEYGDILIKGGNFEEEELVKEVTEPNVVTLIESILDGPYSNQITREYALTALMKLTSRFTNSSVIQNIKSIIEKYSTSIEVEIQQRSVEYTNLFNFDTIRPAVLERMPVPDYKEETSTSRPVYDTISDSNNGSGSGTNNFESEIVDVGSNSNNDIMNLFNIQQPATTTITTPEITTISSQKNMISQQQQPPSSSLIDPLDGLLGLGSNTSNIASQSITSTTPSVKPVSSTSSNSGSIGGFGDISALNATELGSSDQYVAYNKNGFKITLNPTKDINNPNLLDILVTFLNIGVGSTVQNLLFQAAVPKTQKLQMQPPSSTTVIPGSSVTQLIRVMNPAKTNVRLRLRTVYQTSAGGKVDEISEFNGFPQEFW